MNQQGKLNVQMVPQVILEGDNIRDIASFYKELNRVFMQHEDWDLGESLDALNDLLFGGFGLLKVHPNIQLIWNDSNKSSQTLGYATTKAYYLKKLEPGSPFNKAYHKQKLAELDMGKGQTYFQIILEIISEHPNIQLVHN